MTERIEAFEIKLWISSLSICPTAARKIHRLPMGTITHSPPSVRPSRRLGHDWGGLVLYNSFGMAFDPISKEPLERRRAVTRQRHAALLVTCLVLAVAGSALADPPAARNFVAHLEGG